jgi:CcmD family protein
VSGLGFLFIGYAVIWLILGIYLFTLARRESSLQQQVRRLEQDLAVSEKQ